MIIRALVLSVAMFTVAAPALAQDESYKVFDTRPVITEGPYLVANMAPWVDVPVFGFKDANASVLNHLLQESANEQAPLQR